jgi:Zn-dependent protease
MEVHAGDRKESLRTTPLGHVFGIPVGVHYSWFTIFVLLTFALAVGYYPAEFQGWPTVAYWILSALTAILLFVAVLVHELGHAVVALRCKVPVRGITLFIFGGVAQMGEEPPSPVAEFWIAIAGPIASIALAAVLGLLQTVLTGLAPLLAMVKYLTYVNGMLAVFNLMPGLPLDGGRVVRAILWAVTHNLRQATLVAANLGRGVSFLFILLGAWQVVVGNMGTGLWIAFIGWFLETAAPAEVRRQETQGLLAGHSAAEAMDHDQSSTTPMAEARTVQPDSELWGVLQEMDRGGITQLPVMANGQVLGMLTREGIVRLLRTLRKKPYCSE